MTASTKKSTSKKATKKRAAVKKTTAKRATSRKATSKKTASKTTRRRRTTKASSSKPGAVADGVMKTLVDGAMTSIMLVDRDLVVTYANQSTKDLLQQHRGEFLRAYNGFNVDAMVGTCIDVFHKDPQHQRRMLADPANLPFSTDIHVGELTFRINVTAMLNARGQYIGNALEWDDVTEVRRKEAEVARFQAAVQGASTSIMIIDRDFVITYANQAALDLFQANRAEMERVYPGFRTDNLVGTCIDVFHARPQHQRSLLADPRNLPHRADIRIGELQFDLVVSGVFNKNGEYIGNAMEWSDVTQQRDAQEQVERILRASAAGELEERIETENYAGFMKELGDNINTVIDTFVIPLRGVQHVARAISEGNLTESMDHSLLGEFKLVADSMNSSIENLRLTVSQITSAIVSINGGMSNIAKGNDELSDRTQQQAATLEQIAAAIEEITTTVRQNAVSAANAKDIANNAADQAEKGGSVVTNAVQAVGAINQSSKRISDIIGVINEIAFQTNLLALNAAVEAARAGEQGRGFAVVASEVRNLAQRSAAAAKEIKVLIEDTVEKVQEGATLVDASGETLVGIVESVQQVSGLVAQIAQSSQEQALGVEQVNRAVAEIDDVTQQNAALVEEVASASRAMDQQAAQLGTLVRFFNLGDDAIAAPTVLGEIRTSRSDQGAVPANTGVRPMKAVGEDWTEF